MCNSQTIPVVMTIAGSDSGGGAGIQADLKTFQAFGCYGVSAITAITAQNTLEVRQVQGVDAAVLESQIEAILDDFPVAAAKTGMLFSANLIRVTRKTWERKGAGISPVIDPVMVSTSGHRLLAADAIEEMRRFLSIGALITPNLPEASILLEREIISAREMERAAEDLFRKLGVPVLLKGGHIQDEATDELQDLLYDGNGAHVFRSLRQNTTSTHGTGCTLSAAIAAGLAKGESLFHAVGAARIYLQEAIRHAPGFGKGHGPVNHLWKKT